MASIPTDPSPAPNPDPAAPIRPERERGPSQRPADPRGPNGFPNQTKPNPVAPPARGR